VAGQVFLVFEALCERMKMRKLLLALALFTQCSYAETGLKEIYFAFENAYMSNDVSQFEPLLAKDYRISQTLHIPGGVSDTRPASKTQLLTAMRMTGTPNSMPRSDAENTLVNPTDDGGFCGESNTLNEVVISGKRHEEKEIRKVCFKKTNNGYLAGLTILMSTLLSYKSHNKRKHPIRYALGFYGR
jgi:hypothetical protein